MQMCRLSKDGEGGGEVGGEGDGREGRRGGGGLGVSESMVTQPQLSQTAWMIKRPGW